MFELVGKKARVRYESGMECEMEYLSDSELRWAATGGPIKGTSGSEEIESMAVAPGVYFLNWLGDNGVSVSQIIDLSTHSVTAFATFETDDGRRSSFQNGTLELL